MRFKIVYIQDGQKKIETVSADSWSLAKKECEKRGEFVDCQYKHETSDLLYLH